MGINPDYVRYPDSSNFPKGYVFNPDPLPLDNFVRKVRKKFPKLILSADVRASPGARIGVGQDGILPYLNWIMPMDYTRFAKFGGEEEIDTWTRELRSKYPNKIVVPLLRGWICIEETTDNLTACSRTETVEAFKDQLKLDIDAVISTGVKGYGIFTFESLLRDTDTMKLSVIRGELKY